jgi:hypothetical protein
MRTFKPQFLTPMPAVLDDGRRLHCVVTVIFHATFDGELCEERLLWEFAADAVEAAVGIARPPIETEAAELGLLVDGAEVGGADFLGEGDAQRTESEARSEFFTALEGTVGKENVGQHEPAHRRHGQAAFLGEAAHEIVHRETVAGDVVALEEIEMAVGSLDEVFTRALQALGR